MNTYREAQQVDRTDESTRPSDQAVRQAWLELYEEIVATGEHRLELYEEIVTTREHPPASVPHEAKSEETMNTYREAQQVDRTDPHVDEFLSACGLPTQAVRIHLTGFSFADVQAQCQRLAAIYGTQLDIAPPTARRTHLGIEWTAIGTLQAGAQTPHGPS